jgi:hypothetical protein
MEEFFNILRTQIAEHWIKVLVAAGFTILGWFVGRWRAARDWKRREFFNRINVSLNTVVQGKLLIRTVLEKSCEEVFLNKVAVDHLLQAAAKTTIDNPIIPIEKEDRWFFLNAVLNELSETFAAGLFKREAGQGHESIRYLICLTNECDGEIKTRKVRAMVIRKDLLLKLAEEPPQFESPNHSIRWKTLHAMKNMYATEPSHFIEAEIIV